MDHFSEISILRRVHVLCLNKNVSDGLERFSETSILTRSIRFKKIKNVSNILDHISEKKNMTPSYIWVVPHSLGFFSLIFICVLYTSGLGY